jgi:hypothetical protein
MAKLLIDIQEVNKAVIGYVLDHYRDTLGFDYDQAKSARENPDAYIEWNSESLTLLNDLVFVAKEEE